MFDYLRDAEEIYRRSFATVRAEADLGGLPGDMEAVAVRLVHACGMPDIVGDLRFSDGAPGAGRRALADGAPVLVDADMVAAGIIGNRLPAGNRVICTLGETGPAEPGTTRSMAAVEMWRAHLRGAVVAIGNAPTALFRLLEMLSQGADGPALIIGFPVGVVGAAEAKAALAEHAGGVPYITLLGRRGGSAMAAAAVNALAGDGR